MKRILLCFAALLIVAPLCAQDDAENCADHPLVSRMPGFYLYKCEESFNAIDVMTGPEETRLLEGTVFNYEYYLQDGAKCPAACRS